jgi:hypothetical protein
MSHHKGCADVLRANYYNLTDNKLGSGHAHELVAAFFGYKTAAALQAERRFTLTRLGQAEILIPALDIMDARIATLSGLPSDLPAVDTLVAWLCAHLKDQGHVTGEIWRSRPTSDDVDAFIQADPLRIEDALAGEIATTNAYFDEVYVEACAFLPDEDALVVTVEGALNGENDEDRAFHGDKIAFTTVMTFERVAGRIGYRRPEMETTGSVDDAMYYDVDPA